jgi:hypothetical protein
MTAVMAGGSVFTDAADFQGRCRMRTRTIVATLLFAVVMAVSVLSAVPSRRTAVVRFVKPTIIAGAAVMGPVVFEHDDGRMARGEPCTTVYQYNASKRTLGKILVEFMCLPQEREVTSKFVASCSRPSPSEPDRLIEYQFAGETEGHGVPYR